MTLPLLSYPTSCQNQRVSGFEIPGDEQPRIFSTALLPDAQEVDILILAAYRRIFNEQQLLACHRDRFLESQLRSSQISVREFIRGLLLSESFRRLNYECSNNYRFVDMCVQRVLGRQVYDRRETLAWSIVLATEGIQGFVDALLNSDEYLDNFGEETVPYQRRRILPQQAMGEVPFERMPRYGSDHLEQLTALGNDFSATGSDFLFGDGMPPEGLRKVGAVITIAGAIVLSSGILAVILSWFGWLKI
ncbi:phycobilisome rod-core linker polypeptide [Leptothoe sp. ISB3NOV94-8A]|uniref:Phycobilisome rod-core linker polypeptide CpcG n=1 Tax=Adonisia turfae CCMR0081 TaxID=2292702 RepID=A0A6M0RU56_9CYAN|nr:phycobilisome rod-core linker polypeptide [Adonisia turfae]MDV3350427.1 phycobilisome rod-core linker polypeptide [Leptothoe sp. LEGE 181152]NEZ59699.1 phycobilisome rod-core linker polypeptide CpcG [Adonisia turfae CCMR0081]